MTEIANSQPAGPASEMQIAQFEEYIGHPLPTDYRGFLLKHNGGQPVPDAFTLVIDDMEEEDAVMCFFPLRDSGLGKVEVEEYDELRTWPLHCAWDDLQHDLVHLYEKELEHPLLPIGTDGSGNYFCLLLSGDQAGAVVFLEHEMAETVPLGSSFNAFVDSLRPSAE